MRRRALVAVIFLSVAGCGESSVYDDWSATDTASTADAAQANARTSLMKIEEMESQISDLESRLAEVEGEAESSQLAADQAQSDVDALEGEFESHSHY